MNEEERAEIVARAIDALIAGLDPTTSDEHDAGELDHLLEAAEERLFGSTFIAKASLQHEQDVWRAVENEIQDSEIEAVVGSGEPDDDVNDLEDVIAMRRGLASEMFQIAEAHREDVWLKVQARLTDQNRNSGMPDILRSFRRDSDARRLLQAPTNGETTPPVQIRAPASPTTGKMAGTAHDSARARVWAGVSARAHIERDKTPATLKPKNFPVRPLAIAAAIAGAAIVLGPLPATGFAEHPVTRLGETFSGYFGADEVRPPDLAALPAAEGVSGQDASIVEASAISGIQLLQLSALPTGYALESSRYYAGPPTEPRQGTFVLAYRSSDTGLIIYQQRAGGPDLAIGDDAGTSVALSDGTPATLIQGGWLPGDGLAWIDDGSQSLIFERGDIQVVIVVSAFQPLPSLLFEVAEGLN